MNTTSIILVLIAVVVYTPILISVGYRAGYLKALEKAEKIIDDIGRDMLRKKALKTGAPVRVKEDRFTPVRVSGVYDTHASGAINSVGFSKDIILRGMVPQIEKCVFWHDQGSGERIIRLSGELYVMPKEYAESIILGNIDNSKNHFEGRIEEAGCDFCRDEQGYTIGNMYVCDKCGRQVP